MNSADAGARDDRSGAGQHGPGIEHLLEAAVEWERIDPDPASRMQMRLVIERSDPAELADVIGTRLQFGTAGLRAALGPGPNRMNRLVVRRAAAGLSRHLLDMVSDCRERGVVIGRDGRHGSEAFARDVVEVVAAHGIRVYAFDEPVPTPLVACALSELDACAGVVITASHNPASDNGMKVYWGDGAQIVAPIDAGIAAAMEAVSADGAILPDPPGSPAPVRALGGSSSDDEVVLAYLDRAMSIARRNPDAVVAPPVRIASTSLHGVGAPLLERVLRAGGYTDLHQVASQAEPDPDFPTVSFPNPEEPGALDELFALADLVDAAVAIANDPDADRLAVAVRDRGGTWQALSGDETGALLAHHLLDQTRGLPERLVATTIVSSRLLRSMAESDGVHFAETLTGFKWLCRPGIEHPDRHQILLYEEALGYAIGPTTRDKDGIVAALVVADLVAALRRTERSVHDVLDELAERHGVHTQHNGSVRLEGPGALARAGETVDRLVADTPTQLGGIPVVEVDRPAPDVVRLLLTDGTRVVVRPSGTEPKLKYYCEAIQPVEGSVDDARAVARQRLDMVVSDLERLLAR